MSIILSMPLDFAECDRARVARDKVYDGEGFRMPALRGRALSTRAGVRKPPKQEPAGHRCDVMGI